MYTFEYRFYPKQFDEQFIEEFDSDMNWYLGALQTNGLVLREWQNTVKYKTHYACRLIAPEMDSLDQKYYNKYNFECLDTLIKKSEKPPEYEYIGENDEVEECCKCESTNHYVLYTTHISSEPPIICGDCLRPVPLYKFPKTYDESEYYDILNWQRVYRSCDTQFMEGIGERYGYKMMHNPKSPLSREGLRICRFLEDKTGKLFFYFLYDYYTKNKSTCPNCGKVWANTDFERYNYEYVCMDCRLISNKSKEGLKRITD